LRRRLTILEIQEASLIFGTSLDFDRVWVHENVAFPNWIGRLGAAITRQNPPGNNAVTLGNRSYFPVQLKIDRQKIENLELRDMGWLIHELTHAWQFQHTGIRYLFKAILEHIRLGSKVYDYGGEKGLKEAVDDGMLFTAFNPEQQGDITRKMYVALKRGEETPTMAALGEQIRDPGGSLRA
jgi:hypothetical protein